MSLSTSYWNSERERERESCFTHKEFQIFNINFEIWNNSGSFQPFAVQTQYFDKFYKIINDAFVFELQYALKVIFQKGETRIS